MGSARCDEPLNATCHSAARRRMKRHKKVGQEQKQIRMTSPPSVKKQTGALHPLVPTGESLKMMGRA